MKLRTGKTMVSLALLAGLLSACATSREVRQADGWLTHVVGCGGPFLNMGHCQERAARICGGRGYVVLNSQGGELPLQHAMPTGGLPTIPTSLEQFKDSQPRKLLIRCN